MAAAAAAAAADEQVLTITRLNATKVTQVHTYKERRSLVNFYRGSVAFLYLLALNNPEIKRLKKANRNNANPEEDTIDTQLVLCAIKYIFSVNK